MALEPDVSQLRTFVSTIFKHAGTEGFVAIRAFYEADDRTFRFSPTALTGGLDFIVEVAEDDARRAAQAPQPVVFCPPLAVFNNKDHAGEHDISAGLALSTECDTSPQTARQTLEALLGPPTMVVRSGGMWTNGNGETAAKLHLHWVLKEPARAAALVKLKQARMLATALVGGDPTNNPICHPIRWPGSWHRKATPRLCKIETLNPDVEIVLDAALVKLQAAAEAAGISADPSAHAPSEQAQASEGELAAAVAVIANPDLDWSAWNNLGMALWRATAGNAAGLALFDQLSQKSAKYDAANTRARWEHYFRSPPERIGAGTIFHLAYVADPDWDAAYYDELAARIEEANNAGEFDDDPPVIIITLADWLSRDLQPPDFICGKFLTTTSRTIINAETGIGKTLFGIGLGMASAAGLSFLHWAATRPTNVLYVDGEMARRVMQIRLRDAVARLGNVPPPTGFHMISHEDVAQWAPLNNRAGQAFIETQIKRIGNLDLIIFDNIMSLIAGDQKDEIGWEQAMPWLRSLTRRRIAQVWLHHTGHDTTRGYGTKTREWQMDNVLHFEKVEREETDVSFKLTFVKAREREPATRNDFREVKITLTDNVWTWEAQSGGGLAPISTPITLKFYEALCLATAASGQTFNGCPAATMEQWKAQCERTGLMDSQARPDSARAQLSKYRLQLIGANWIASNATLAWTLAPNRHAGPM